MKVLMIEPGKKPRKAEIDGSLEGMQKVVGGYIQAIYPFEDPVALICNEEGKLWGLEPNIFLISGTNVDEVVGPILIVKDAGEEFGELTEEEANTVCKKIGGSGIWQM